MNEWIDSLQAILRQLLGDPGSNLEMWVLVAGAFLIMWAIVGKVGSLLGIINTRPAQTFIVTLVGLVLSFAALAAMHIYLPVCNEPEYRLWTMIGVPLAVTLVLIAPFMGLFQKANYISAVVAWALAVAGAACVILLVGALFDSFASGSRDADKGKAHKEELEQIQQ